MKNTIEAKYFDGQSSVSRWISILFEETAIDELCLQTENEVLAVWHPRDLQWEQYGGLLEIRNRNHPGAVLVVEDKLFLQKFYESMRANRRVDIHTRLVKLGIAKIAGVAVFLLALIVLAYFYILPFVAEKAAALLPESFDNQVGDMFMETFIEENKVDSVKTRFLEQFASGLDLENTKPLHFTVVKSDEVNAFALPNGQVVVYTGILDDMESADELAGLLGHEVSHVNSRHSTKMLCRNFAGYMIVSLLFSDANGIMSVIADNAQQLHSLSYSRKFEQEADEQGLKILMKNNVNPNGMVMLFEQLEKQQKTSVPEILSTHPLTSEREKNMKKIISASAFDVKPNEKLSSIFERLKN